MTNAQPGAIQKFRDTTARHGVPMSHVPKRCACGKATSAKQLTQYQCCVICARKDKVRAARPVRTSNQNP